MSGSYWYEQHPELLAAEKDAMALYFPQFKLQTLSDNRLYWTGQVNPRGAAGGIWTLMAIYNHDHPSNAAANGSSVRIYSVKPDLNDLTKAIGGPLPHVLIDSSGNYYMCTARRIDVSAGYRGSSESVEVTSAAQSLGWAVKWIWLVEGWLAGEVESDDIFGHVF